MAFASNMETRMLERAKPSNILAGKKHFCNKKMVEINVEDSLLKKNNKVHKTLFFTDIYVFNKSVLLILDYNK